MTLKKIKTWVSTTCNKAIGRKITSANLSEKELRREAKIFIERYGETLKKLAQE